tara:strand:+ start:478 stop:1860 length:1383 start_codon:yes stop_codon:yes gene_type:complete
MNNKTHIFIFLLLTLSFAQVSPDYKPYSLKFNKIELNSAHISVDRYYIDVNFKSIAIPTVTPNGIVWRLKIQLDQIYKGYLLFSNWSIPSGAMLFVLIDDTTYTGPYLSYEPNEFLSGRFESNNLTLEYFEPIGSHFKGDFIIESVQAYENLTIKPLENEHNARIYLNRDRPKILVTGYWPPTNEMVRHFSQNLDLNPNGWQGENWEDLGFDVISFFPEFNPPDCNNCGQGYGDLEVDYQDFSMDFWPIVEQVKPVGIITFSRGYNDLSWEIENRLVNRTNWIEDYTAPLLPTPNPPDNTVNSYFVRYTSLPISEIINEVENANLGLEPYLDNTNAGMFLSEFAGYHGVWYKESQIENIESPCFASGHIHVGGQINWETAKEAAEISIRTLINFIDPLLLTIGDCNDDGYINILDVIMLINAILGETELTASQFLAADIDYNNELNIFDIINMINLILEI